MSYDFIPMSELLDSVVDLKTKRQERKIKKALEEQTQAALDAAVMQAQQLESDAQQLEEDTAKARQERLYGLALSFLTDKQRKKILVRVCEEEERAKIRRDQRSMRLAWVSSIVKVSAAGIALITALYAWVALPDASDNVAPAIIRVIKQPPPINKPYPAPKPKKPIDHVEPEVQEPSRSSRSLMASHVVYPRKVKRSFLNRTIIPSVRPERGDYQELDRPLPMAKAASARPEYNGFWKEMFKNSRTDTNPFANTRR